MGILKREFKVYYTLQSVDLKQITTFLNNKFSNKYKVVFQDKGGIGKQVMTGQKDSSVLIIKNAYHRQRIKIHFAAASTPTESGKDEIIFSFIEAELKWWLNFLHREAGMIGRFIIGLIYGNGKEFHQSIIDALVQEYDVKERTIVADATAFFKRNKKSE